MTIDIPCPHCKNMLEIPVQYVGQIGKCKYCDGEVLASVSGPSKIMLEAEAELKGKEIPENVVAKTCWYCGGKYLLGQGNDLSVTLHKTQAARPGVYTLDKMPAPFFSNNTFYNQKSVDIPCCSKCARFAVYFRPKERHPEIAQLLKEGWKIGGYPGAAKSASPPRQNKVQNSIILLVVCVSIFVFMFCGPFKQMYIDGFETLFDITPTQEIGPLAVSPRTGLTYRDNQTSHVNLQERPPIAKAAFKGNVSEVTSGCTMWVKTESQPQLVILYGVLCPDTEEELGICAKDFSSSLVLGKEVSIDIIREDGIVDYVVLQLSDGRDLRKLLIAEGLATCSKEMDDLEFHSLQTQAQKKQVGIWSTGDVGTRKGEDKANRRGSPSAIWP